MSPQLGSPIVVEHLTASEFREAQLAPYNQLIGIHTLFEDPTSGVEHHVIRYPAGLRGGPHRHTAAHTIIVLEGELEVNGRVIGPHSYAHFPAGEPMQHQASGDQPCVFVLCFDGPFDVEVLED
ncbi:MAG: cupin domain-containing protein [Candidatus Dormibacteraeota bacterium]|nr:cupin domain-containing protein [Candidatus Dormibacteraeota bacterium]